MEPSAAKPLGLNTLLAHAGCDVDATTGAITPPIHFSTTFERDADLQFSKGFIYARVSNPTRKILEDNIAKLEGGTEAAAFASGMAACCAVFQSIPGGHCIIPDDIYHGIRTVLQTTYAEWGLKYDECDMSNLEAVKAAVREVVEKKKCKPGGTLVVWLETPSNPQTKVTDIDAVCKLVRKEAAALVFYCTFQTIMKCIYSLRSCLHTQSAPFEVIVAVDATWVTPWIMKPISMGADLVSNLRRFVCSLIQASLFALTIINFRSCTPPRNI